MTVEEGAAWATSSGGLLHSLAREVGANTQRDEVIDGAPCRGDPKALEPLRIHVWKVGEVRLNLVGDPALLPDRRKCHVHSRREPVRELPDLERRAVADHTSAARPDERCGVQMPSAGVRVSEAMNAPQIGVPLDAIGETQSRVRDAEFARIVDMKEPVLGAGKLPKFVPAIRHFLLKYKRKCDERIRFFWKK